MKRIAGMTIEDGRASIFVLAREGDTWRVERSNVIWIAAAHDPRCPVVLGEGAWQENLKQGIGAIVRRRLRAAGWDVRPLLWIDGRAADPTPQQLIDAPGYLDLFHSLVPATPISLHGAMSCAAWGATQETTAEPPRCATAAVWAHSADVDAVPGARAAEVPRAESEIARLTRERDEARRECDRETGKYAALNDAVEDVLDRALGESWGGAEDLPSPQAEATAIGILAAERDEAVRRAVRAESLAASLSREMESLGRVGQAYKDERDEAVRRAEAAEALIAEMRARKETP